MTDDVIKIRDGEVVLYRRKGSLRWQARFKLPNGDWHRVTTKKSSIDDAKRIAGDAYDRARFRHQEGLIPVTRRFRDVAKHTIELLERDIAGGKGRVAYKDYIQAINNHLIPFFGKKNIDKITQDELSKFDAWRVEKMEKIPSKSTVMNHNSALNRVFQTALQEGWVQQKNIPVIQNNGVKSNRRPDFTMDEWNKITANLRHWVKKGIDQRTKNMRELMWDYVLILGNTGIRTGTEAYNLKWKQLRWHVDSNNQRFLVIHVKGKTGERELVARHGCENFFERIQSRFPDLAKMTFDQLIKAKVDQYVFRLRDGKRTQNLYQTFHQFLTEHQLLEDGQGNHRTLYSLRHMYATMRLTLDHASIHQLAKQMGTSVAMLEKHYSHLEPIMVADVFAGKRHN